MNNNKDNMQTTILNDTYREFKFLVDEGVDIEESFKSTVSEMLEEASEAILDVSFQLAYKDGYVDALRRISDQTDSLADALELDDHVCEDCKEEMKMSECGDCDCEDGCELD